MILIHTLNNEFKIGSYIKVFPNEVQLLAIAGIVTYNDGIIFKAKIDFIDIEVEFNIENELKKRENDISLFRSYYEKITQYVTPEVTPEVTP
jgi:hypothetical protein